MLKLILIFAFVAIIIVPFCIAEKYEWNVRMIEDQNYKDHRTSESDARFGNERTDKFSHKANKNEANIDKYDLRNFNYDVQSPKKSVAKKNMDEHEQKFYDITPIMRNNKSPGKFSRYFAVDESNDGGNPNFAQNKNIHSIHEGSQSNVYKYYNPSVNREGMKNFHNYLGTNKEKNTVSRDYKSRNDDFDQNRNGFDTNFGQELPVNNYDHTNNENFPNEDNPNNGITNSHQCSLKYSPIPNFLGTNLFGISPKECFTLEDVQTLILRRDFEILIPKDLPQCLLNDQFIMLLLDYFKNCHRLITTTKLSKNLSEQIFFDTLGSYLNYYLVPIAKYSYYAGIASLDAVQSVMRLYEQCKYVLNTNGNGWKEPSEDIFNQLKMIQIQPLKGAENNGYDGYTNPCFNLNMNNDRNEPGKIHIPLPKLESENENGDLGNIWLPFKRKRIYDLKSPDSAFILLRFYETVRKCYQYKKMSDVCYNRQLKEWLLQNIQKHLSDNIFYPGLGGILQIIETLRKFRKFPRQSDYEDYDDYQSIGYKETNNGEANLVSRGLQNYHHYLGHQNLWPNAYIGNYNHEYYPEYLENTSGQMKNEEAKTKDIESENKQKDEKLETNAQNTQQQDDITQNQNETPKHPLYRYFELTTINITIIVISLAIILLCLIVCCLKLKRKNTKNKHIRLREYGGSKKHTTIDDEEETEFLIPQSKSVIHGNNSKSMYRSKANYGQNNNSTPRSIASSSTSSLTCASGCFPKKQSGPAIIETTSLDADSSEIEYPKEIKHSTKTVKIDEKPLRKSSVVDKRPNGLSQNAKTKNDSRDNTKK
ncbi:uncharacterized protein LOC142222342 isoform X2 [Haematobia irritans]|uniref:uncharacterized protein LOC142222342 isoform X2 n=1 Tax=Haematobia irritans TaxID=7368 RepID=UPI003F50102C